MKYKINDEVLINAEGQLGTATVVKVKKYLLGNRYTVTYGVDLYDGAQFLYERHKIKKFWERQILGIYEKTKPKK